MLSQTSLGFKKAVHRQLQQSSRTIRTNSYQKYASLIQSLSNNPATSLPSYLKDPLLKVVTPSATATKSEVSSPSSSSSGSSGNQAVPYIYKELLPDWQLLRDPSHNRRVHTIIGGIRIQVAGRKGLYSHRETKSFGSFQFSNYYSLLDYGTATRVDKKGSTGVKVWIKTIPVVFK